MKTLSPGDTNWAHAPAQKKQASKRWSAMAADELAGGSRLESELEKADGRVIAESQRYKYATSLFTLQR
jgi:hypothetical protein